MKKILIAAFALALVASPAVKADELARGPNNASFVMATEALKTAKSREDFASISTIRLDRNKGIYEVTYTDTAGELVMITMNALLTKVTM